MGHGRSLFSWHVPESPKGRKHCAVSCKIAYTSRVSSNIFPYDGAITANNLPAVDNTFGLDRLSNSFGLKT